MEKSMKVCDVVVIYSGFTLIEIDRNKKANAATMVKMIQ